MNKPILSIDFDGVIHSYSSGWKGVANIPDPPVPGAIDALLRYLDEGFDVAIFSSRSRNIFGRRAMKRWLGKHISEHWNNGGSSPSYAEAECMGDAFDVIHKFSWPWFKPSALITLDDRALTFDGTWPTVESIRAFRPWNKRPTAREAL